MLGDRTTLSLIDIHFMDTKQRDISQYISFLFHSRKSQIHVLNYYFWMDYPFNVNIFKTLKFSHLINTKLKQQVEIFNPRDHF